MKKPKINLKLSLGSKRTIFSKLKDFIFGKDTRPNGMFNVRSKGIIIYLNNIYNRVLDMPQHPLWMREDIIVRFFTLTITHEYLHNWINDESVCCSVAKTNLFPYYNGYLKYSLGKSKRWRRNVCQ